MYLAENKKICITGNIFSNCKSSAYFSKVCRLPGSRDSVVGIVTSYGLDDLGVAIGVPVGSRIFSSPDC
jgi:hypothetical protein